jgi:hypothetical protein
MMPPALQASAAKEMPDGTITFAVEDALLADQGVFPNDVDVTTSHGIVTLSGSVENLLIRQRVIRIAESLRGVRAVVSLLSVTPVVRPDEDIRKDILIALLQDPATYAYQVAVSVRNGVATSPGTWAPMPRCISPSRSPKGVIGLRDIQQCHHLRSAASSAPMQRSPPMSERGWNGISGSIAIPSRSR